MALRFDEKGKYYTDYVTKEGIPVVIQMVTHHIRGYVYVQEDERLSDELNRQEQFLPVTQAVVLDTSGNKQYEAQFLAVNRSHIVWMYPEEMPSIEEVNAVEELLVGEEPIVGEEVYQVPEAHPVEGMLVFDEPFEAGIMAGDNILSDTDLPDVDETQEDNNA